MDAKKSYIGLQVNDIRHIKREVNKFVGWLANKVVRGSQGTTSNMDLRNKE